MQRTATLVIVVLAAVAALAFSLLTPGVSAEEPDKGANSGATADGVVAIYPTRTRPSKRASRKRSRKALWLGG